MATTRAEWYMIFFMLFTFILICGRIGYSQYHNGNIFAPIRPNNITEIQNWNLNKISRLSESMQCWGIVGRNTVTIPSYGLQKYADC
jgi:hypothetical protein